MTLDEEFAKYQGQSVLVPGQPEVLRGQCFMWFDFVLHDVYGYPYFYAEGAIDIWNNPGWLLQYFDKITDGSIKKGDIVVFNQNVGSIYGHVDIAMQDGTTDSFQGSDSNWGGNKTVHLVNHVGRQYVLGSLRLKGGNMDAQKIADQRFQNEQRIASKVGWSGDPDDTDSIIGKIDGLYYIANTRGDNAKKIADLLGVSNPDDTNATIAAIKALQANQGGQGYKPYSGPTLYVKE